MCLYTAWKFLFSNLVWLIDFPDDAEEYEDVSEGNRLLGFMFGNVDNAGDLDVDYLDEVIIWTCFMYKFAYKLTNNDNS